MINIRFLIKKVWHDPVWSKVIANGIWGILLISGVVTIYICELWSSLYNWIILETVIPNWMLVVLCILSLTSLIKIVRILRSYMFPPQKNTPAWIIYNSALYTTKHSNPFNINSLRSLVKFCLNPLIFKGIRQILKILSQSFVVYSDNSDIFFNILWRWTYNDNGYTPIDIKPHCSNCHYPLDLDNSYDYDGLRIHCEKLRTGAK